MTRTEPEDRASTTPRGAPWEPMVRALERRRPPLPRFRSPLRGPWLTSVLGAVLLAALPVVILTGLLSYIAYGPQFGQAIPDDVGFLHLPWFDWPASPSWLYRLTQGLHVGLGLVLVPVVLAKLWSVAPKLFAWPPVRSPAQALERLSLLLLVGGILFEIVTGLLNIQYDYVFGFSFYAAHYVGAWVFIGGFVAHVALKLPHMWRALRSRSPGAELRTSVAATRPEEPDPHGLVAPDPAPPTMSRRGLLALVGGGSLLVAALTAGQTVGGPLRGLAFLLPRGRTTATADGGPNDFPVNKTFVASGIDPGALDAWVLELTGGTAPVRLDRDKIGGLGLTAIPPDAYKDILVAGQLNMRVATLFDGKELRASIFESTPAKTDHRTRPNDTDEFVYVVSGKLILTEPNGTAHAFQPGDSLVLPLGYTGTWEMQGNYREIAVTAKKIK